MSTVLIVDDEAPIREMLAAVLEDEGYRVIGAAHGGEALDLVKREPPDLIMSDVMMPIMGGAELCQRLKRDPVTRQIPIILMSSAGRLVALDSGSDAYIDKPFEIASVESLVRGLLERRTTL